MNSKQVNEATNRLLSFMGDIKDGNLRTLLANMQTMCEYQAEKLRIYEEHFTELTGKARPELSDSDKRRLAQRGKTLNDYLLATVEPTWCVGTIRGWYNSLVGAKYDSTAPGQRKRGRKPISPEIVEKILYLQSRNPDWGYDRIAGTMRYLGYDVSATTIRKVLDDHGIVPDPERRKRGDWQQFIETQQYVAAATDFATVEVLTEHGLVREHLLFFMDIGSREVRLGGIAHNPDSNWATQIARNMCDMWDGFLLGKKYLIHDRDSLFNKRFDMIFESIGIEIKKLPPFCPMMNARCENFIRALKTECLDKIIFTSQEQLRVAVKEYLEYWNRYRPHSGLDGRMIQPYEQDMDGEIREVSFLGGLLHGYRRERVAA
jgi:transposase InsO family protein